MIISHEHAFIFLHCRKVAGSSITALLNRSMGPDDIQVGAWPDALEAGGRVNRRAWKTIALHPGARRVFRQGAWRALRRGRRPRTGLLVNSAIREAYRDAFPVNAAHATAAAVRAFDPEAWARYTKVCFVRNPFDEEVSDYFWRNQKRHPVSFEEFLRRKLDPTRPDPEGLVPTPATNWEIYTIDDEVVVDFVGRYERLGEDLARLGARLGLDLDLGRLPNAKGGVRRERDYRALYSEEAIALVEALHRKELDRFGYRFEPAPAAATG